MAAIQTSRSALVAVTAAAGSSSRSVCLAQSTRASCTFTSCPRRAPTTPPPLLSPPPPLLLPAAVTTSPTTPQRRPRPLATLPLLVLPSTAAAEEICGLYDNMTSELQRLWLLMRTNDGGSDEDGDSALPSYGDAGTARAVAFQDHFLPFANDAAHLITSCHALVQGRSAATVTYSGSSAGGGGGG
ncbi:hypothetical protein Agub_g16053, partial [Astrephomene gubernaculifera]